MNRLKRSDDNPLKGTPGNEPTKSNNQNPWPEGGKFKIVDTLEKMPCSH